MNTYLKYFILIGGKMNYNKINLSVEVSKDYSLKLIISSAGFVDDFMHGGYVLQCGNCEKNFFSRDNEITTKSDLNWVCPHCGALLYYPPWCSW